MLHAKFRGIGQPVTVEKIFEGFLPYLGMAVILAMCPASYQQIFVSMYLKAYRQNLVNQRTNGPVNAHLTFPGINTTVKCEKGATLIF